MSIIYMSVKEKSTTFAVYIKICPVMKMHSVRRIPFVNMHAHSCFYISRFISELLTSPHERTLQYLTSLQPTTLLTTLL